MLAKKSLGQNFLKSGAALNSIVVAGDIKAGDVVLEIGPGRGALTGAMLQSGAKVVAVEKDRDLIPYLSEKFAKEIKDGKLILIEGDILEMKVSEITPLAAGQHFPQIENYKLIANIPYYITGEIIRKFLEEDRQPERMVLLVQKEVAERIVAKDGKESILSIASKAYGTPKMIAKVPRGAFVPAPNVDSAVIALTNISKDLFIKNKVSEEDFFKVMKAGFAHKRKKLSGNLKDLASKLNQECFPAIKEKRAEELSVLDWFDLIGK